MLSKFLAVTTVVVCTFLLGGTPGDFNPKRSDAFERGYYVPENLEDAVAQLEEALHTQAKNELRDTQEDQIAAQYHETLGSWMRRHWLYRDSRLRQHFASEGLRSRDGASSVILKAVWRDLNGRPIEAEALMAAARNADDALRPPEDTMCPDRPDERMEMLFKIVTVEPVEVVHVARCSSTGNLWTFEIKTGWSRPDPKTLAEINLRMNTDHETP